MNEERTIWWWVLGAFMLLAAAAAWYFWPARTAPAVEPVAQVAPAPPAEPAAPEAPRIEHPIEQAPAAAEPPQAPSLPSLAESDSALRAAIGGLVGDKAFVDFFQMRDLVSRIVATVDNLPRAKVAQRVMPLRGPGGAFVVDGGADARVIGEDNAARYAAHMAMLDALDVKKAAALYVRFYPLLQQAYRDLGYPQGHFNDRLVAVIDHLLATPEVAGPIRLVQPKVLYEFADPDLESRSAGQKLLLRMGAGNAARVKSKLRAFRREITATPPQ